MSSNSYHRWMTLLLCLLPAGCRGVEKRPQPNATDQATLDAFETVVDDAAQQLGSLVGDLQTRREAVAAEFMASGGGKARFHACDDGIGYFVRTFADGNSYGIFWIANNKGLLSSPCGASLTINGKSVVPPTTRSAIYSLQPDLSLSLIEMPDAEALRVLQRIDDAELQEHKWCDETWVTRIRHHLRVVSGNQPKSGTTGFSWWVRAHGDDDGAVVASHEVDSGNASVRQSR